MGGLGNMMFQIATAKSFSISRNTNCSFPNFYNHLFYLEKDEVYNPHLKNSKEYVRFLNLKTDLPHKNIKTYYYPFHYDSFMPSEENFYIHGYFQSEKYFMLHKDEIKDFFKPNKKILDLIDEKYSELLKQDTLGIHVRRGDYLKFSDKHKVQSKEYYYKSINAVKNYQKLVVFSDDIKWCKQNFCEIKNIFYVENEKDYIELFLMTKMKNLIISNSSFSWWGAWLNNKAEKIIAPKVWFGKSMQDLETKDLLPENWIKV